MQRDCNWKNIYGIHPLSAVHTHVQDTCLWKGFWIKICRRFAKEDLEFRDIRVSNDDRAEPTQDRSLQIEIQNPSSIDVNMFMSF